jgi:SAM-dependent methyltransferase
MKTLLKETAARCGIPSGLLRGKFLRPASDRRLKAGFIALDRKGDGSIAEMGDFLLSEASQKDIAKLVGWQHGLFKSGERNVFRELCKVVKKRIEGGYIVPDIDGPIGRKFMSYVGKGLVEERFSHLSLGGGALQTLLSEYDFDNVLDVGCGAGLHAKLLKEEGKEVILNDYGKSIYYDEISSEHEVIVGDFLTVDFEREFDCVWASHVLEHQRDVGAFLRKAHSVLKRDGLIAVSVPPLKNELVGGHLTLWTPGHLLYNLAINGFDCSTATVLVYGYNISVIARKTDRPLPDDIAFDNGDVDKLAKAGLLPKAIREGTDGWDPVLYRLP